MPTPQNVIFFSTPAELGAWFEANHEAAEELWAGYHSKRARRPSITHAEVVDQALCFGWIDSVVYRIGDHTIAQRLTPRRKRSIWSAVNTRRFIELRAQGLVHARGEAAFAQRDEARSAIYAYENRSASFDAEQEAVFRRHKKGWEFFTSQAPWYRRTATYWVMSAKRDETRERRLKALIEHSAKGERIPPLSRTSPSRSPRSPSRAS